MNSFTAFFKGHLQGIMNEESYINMAKSLRGEWFGVDFSSPSTEISQFTGDEVHARLLHLYENVKSRKSVSGKFPHTYVHNRENPVFIKLYDPVKCGGSCSKVAPDPWWVFSMVQPLEHEIREILKKST